MVSSPVKDDSCLNAIDRGSLPPAWSKIFNTGGLQDPIESGIKGGANGRRHSLVAARLLALAKNGIYDQSCFIYSFNRGSRMLVNIIKGNVFVLLQSKYRPCKYRSEDRSSRALVFIRPRL